jgi:hypothetical protein
MERSDIYELLLLKLTGGLHATELVKVDQLISSDVEVLNSWQVLHDFFLGNENRRSDFESLSASEIMSGVKASFVFAHKSNFAEVVTLYWQRALAFTKALSFPLDLKFLFASVHSNVLSVLNVMWIDRGYLSREECRSWITRIADHPFYLKILHSRAFEEIVGELFRNDGFDVSFTKRSADGGIDVIVRGETKVGLQKYAIQCKLYRGRKVEIEAVRSLYGVKVHGNFTQAILVTTSSFTKPAIRFSNERPYELTLKNGRDVINWCIEYRDRNSDRVDS